MKLKNIITLVGLSLLPYQPLQDTTPDLANTLTLQRETPKEPVMKDTREKVFLTIDDGPSKYTQAIVDTLNKLGHKAIFFFVGEMISEKYTPVIQQLLQDGHQIGNHSYSHHYFSKMTLDQAKNELDKTDTKFEHLIGQHPKYFRYPGGIQINKHLRAKFIAHLKEKGYHEQHVFWDIDTNDWRATTSRADLVNTLSKIQPGDIILIHERKRTIPETLVIIDSIFKTKNLYSVPLDEKEEKRER